MKQEQLKVALCGYLPYGCMVGNLINEGFTYDLKYTNIEHVISHNNTNKPILYNLNCLTKPIIVKGYNGGLPFVPIEEIKTNYRLDILTGVYSDGSKCLWNEKTQSSSYRYWEYAIIEKLNRWKIDYRNLIGQGLAIDVETLKNNCYE